MRSLIKLARPTQWSKGVFVAVGPMYGMALGQPGALLSLAGVLIAFSCASSACYVLNDLRDVEQDRLHPRKKNRPIASGAVSPGAAGMLALGCLALAAAGVAMVFFGVGGRTAGLLTSGCVAAYVFNVVAYTHVFKHRPVMDVMSLALGFVLRVLGGCAALGVEPSAWLLNCTFFVSMFLALGKRLGERRTMGSSAAATEVRGVQAHYTDDLLRMLVVMTAVACLLSYSDYVQAKALEYTPKGGGFNLLWLTMLPATYALFRAVLLLERGIYDDPTEAATRDRAFQFAVLVFGAMTAGLMVLHAQGVVGQNAATGLIPR